MWPTCINNLHKIENSLRAKVPKFIRQAFNSKGIFDDDKMFIPIRPVSILGECSTGAYVDCPNIPDYHLENAQYCGDDPAEYLDDVGKYYWFDFDVVALDGELLQLRMVFNEGDGDCNDGLWGAVWEIHTEELVANILSTGDSEATVEAVSKKYIDMYQNKNMWVPTEFDRDNDPLPCCSINYANNFKLEEIIGLAIRLCCVCRSEWTYSRFGYSL